MGSKAMVFFLRGPYFPRFLHRIVGMGACTHTGVDEQA
jgi:hypothetical protein